MTTARDVIAPAAEKGLEMIDAPVSGGVGGGYGRHADLYVRRHRRGLSRAEPILAIMGKNIFHAGAAGNGQAAKVCNNLMLAIQMIAVSEAFCWRKSSISTPRNCGISASTATSQCWAMTNYCPVPGPVIDIAGQPRL